MSKKILCTLVWLLLAAGVASSATVFVERSAKIDHFCDGYAICK